MKEEYYIKKCIEIAKKGEGKVAPNPLVGAILTDLNGNIVSSGYHEFFGGPHAEVNALNKGKGEILYVSLEPCNHWGKTPPCSQRIIESGIKKLVIGMGDPNPLAKGGAQVCREAGIEVIEGVLTDECKKLNEIFIKNIEKNFPFVAIKTATTFDSKIALENGASKWITNDLSREYVQKLRNKYDAILTGSETILADDPYFTSRIEKGRNPQIVVLDRRKRVKKDANIYKSGAKVHIYSEFDSIKEVLNDLKTKGITSVLVESGPMVVSSILKENLADKMYKFIAPKIFGNGKNFVEDLMCEKIEDCIKLKNIEVKTFNDDILIEGYFC